MPHSRKIRKTKTSNMRKEGHCEAAVFLFCVLVQNGRVSLAKRGNLACPAGAQEGRHLRFPPSCESPLSLRGSGADCRHVTAAKKGTAEDFFYRRGAQCAPMPKPIRSAGYRSATHAGYSAQAQHNSVAQLVSLEFTDSTCEFRRLVQFILADPVYYTRSRVARHCHAAPEKTFRSV